jgi:hypothetical protein
MIQLTLATNNEAHPEYSDNQIAQALGLLPLWVAEHVGNDDDTDIVQFMTDRYGCGRLYDMGGSLMYDGTYASQYPDDEDLPYMGRMITKHGYAYFYEYGIVALPLPNGKHFITRMD